MSRRLTRRRALQAAALSVGIGLAGCTQLSGRTQRRTDDWSPSPVTASPGSWPLSGYDSAQRRYVPYSNELQTGVESTWQYEGEELRNVLVHSDAVYVGDDRVRALDAKTGETRWTFEADADARLLALAGGTLYVATGDGVLHALRAA